MDREHIEELFYGRPEHQRRFTQDLPILPDVWIADGKAPGDRVEVLLTPFNQSDAASVAVALRSRLERDRTAEGERQNHPAPESRSFLAEEAQAEPGHIYRFRADPDLSITVELTA